jgi:hypothetical protein
MDALSKFDIRIRLERPGRIVYTASGTLRLWGWSAVQKAWDVSHSVRDLEFWDIDHPEFPTGRTEAL